MYEGQYVFSQVMGHMPWKTFHRCVSRYQGNHRVKAFTCAQQFRAMSIAQLNRRSSLRDLVVCLQAHQDKLYHLGLSGGISRSTPADANETRDWRIYSDHAQRLIEVARPLYGPEDCELNLQETVYALDSSTIDLCLSLFPWALFRKTKSGIKLHTLLDLQGNIPSFIEITDARLNDVNILDALLPEPGAIYVMDRAYLDFERLHTFQRFGSYFVVRAKSNTQFRRLYSHASNRDQGLVYDQSGVLTGVNSARRYPDRLRRIKYVDPERDRTLVFLTNNTYLPALTIARLYKNRWQVELFFRWVKQHLRIQSFYGTSENAVKTQIWIGVSVYVLLAIIKKRLQLDASLYTISQILDTTLFEKTPLYQLLAERGYKPEPIDQLNQLNLFDFLTGHF
ncbi:MAG: IS4 family transposase [Gammaproteobacteria bacterium]|nr:IS4 family transposase [Gammaproteobacteria bacterium]